MEAKDTVMEEMAIRVLYNHDFWGNVMKQGVGKLLRTQAEISFKAGEKVGIRKAIDNLKMHYCIIDVEARIKEIEGFE